MIRTATFDTADPRYRYRLGRDWRQELTVPGPWQEQPAFPLHGTRQGAYRRDWIVLYIGLNPSTADALRDDPTIRRMIGFARDWGYGRLEVCNLFAWRATDPRGLAATADPIGPGNDAAIRQAAREAALIVCGWGAHPLAKTRGLDVVNTLLAGHTLYCRHTLYCLGRAKDGAPRHPLYLAKSTAPEVFL